ncbi:MAG: hypothetical protein HY706_06445 [Candidatus Hydrogenedentes bacterium]|nr:hypothetical protein [Candidatus Hydrogenedentota bacterium]
MVATLLEKRAQWLKGDGPEAVSVVVCRGSLYRNLADFPFPARCSPDEKKAVEDRVWNVLESSNLLAGGQYYSFRDLDPKVARFLAERQMIPREFLRNDGHRGVFVSDDQTVSIMINEEEHVRIQVMASGLQAEEVWNRLSALDDQLSAHLDFAFDSRLGYLTSSVDRVGTGLKLSVTLHLPAMTAVSKMIALEQRIRAQRHALHGVYGNLNEGRGALYQLSNHATLGRSEPEIVYHLRHTAADVLAEEKAARDSMTLLAQGVRSLEDRVGRAMGVARGARLIEFTEALEILSSLRLGIAAGFVKNVTIQQLNELLIAVQPAHLELRKGHECDEVTLSMERADLFRARFS